MSDDRLHLYVADSNNNLSEVVFALDDYVQEWTVGPYRAQWRFSVPTIKESGLRAWFANKLMARVRATYSGSGRWHGYITNMRMDYGGQRLIKDIANVVTAAKCRFNTDMDFVTDEEIANSALYKTKSDMQFTYTGWSGSEEGLNRFGRIESMVYLDNVQDINPWQLVPGDPMDLGPSEAHVLAEAEITRNSSPFVAQIAPASDSEKMEIRVTALGNAELANYIILGNARLENPNSTGLRSVAEDSAYAATRRINEITVSQEIARIVDVVNYATDIEGRTPLLYDKGIEMTNKVPTFPGVDSETGAMDRLKQLGQIRDLDENYYRLQVDLDGGVIYEQLDKTPRYYLYPPPKGLRTPGDKVPTWDAKPDIIKIIDPIYGVGLPNTWLGDGSLILPERSTMRMQQDVAAFVPDEHTEVDFRLAKEAHERRLIQKRKRLRKK